MILTSFPRLRRALTLVVTTVLAIGTAVATAPPAAASDDYCASPSHYLLLMDPSHAADLALCRVQEDTLQRLSEDQWGEPYTDEQRTRMLSWGRSDALGAMYVELLKIASSDHRTPDEATVYAWLQTTLAALRNQMAEAAYAEQIEYQSDPCGYTPPTPGATKVQCGNSGSLMTLFGPPPGPTYEQFVNYGAQRALSENFGTAQLTTIGAMARSARDQLIGAAVGVVGGIGIGVGMVAAATAGLAYSAMLVSMGAITASTTAATAAVSAVGAFVVSAAASVAFVALAVTLAVVRGVSIAEENAIPGQLRDDIAAAKQPVDIESWIGDDSSKATLLLQAIARRINPSSAPQAAVPNSPGADAQGFLVTSAGQPVAFTRQLRFRSPTSTDQFFTAWMDHGWWVIQDDAGHRALTHTLVYVDHAGKTRSASWMSGNQFLVATLGTSDSSTDCTPANGCATTDALDIVTPSADSGQPAVDATATLHTADLTLNNLPDLKASYSVGESLTATVSVAADYLTTMSYRWELTSAGGSTSTIDSRSLDALLVVPGDYHLQVTATASSGESATHGWDFTVTGEQDGQQYSGIQLTQYSADGATFGDTTGDWIEGSTEGTICLWTGSTDETDYTLQFAGEDAVVHSDVTVGYSCFPRPASASKAGEHEFTQVKACPSEPGATLCWPTDVVDYVNGLWVQHSPFTYTVTNEPPSASDVILGPSGSTLATTTSAAQQQFTVGDTVEAKATVTDPGRGPLTVYIRWSDGTEDVQSNVASETEITATHQYDSVAWGPVGVQIWAVDDTGATGNLATGWFVVHPKPITDFDLDAVVGDDGLVTVTGTIGDPGRTATLLGISWGDGTGTSSGGDTDDPSQKGFRYDAPFPAPPSAEASTAGVGGQFQLTHRYASSGHFTVGAVVWNGSVGDGYAAAAADVQLRTRLAVVSDGPIKVTATDVETSTSTVSFDALLGNLGDDDLSVDVDFGDGGTHYNNSDMGPGDSVPLTRDFADGEHTITITVTAGDGATSYITRCFVLTGGVVTPCTEALPASGDDIRDNPSGPVDAPDSAQGGATITVSLGADHQGETVTLYLYSTPTLLGTFTADADGNVTLRLPTSVPAGSHTVAAFVGAALVGWAALTVTPAAGPGDTTDDQGTGDTTNGDGAVGAGSDTATQPGAAPSTAASGSDIAPTDAAGQPTAPGLAATGVGTSSLLGLALLLLAAGLALVAASRRRARHIRPARPTS